MKLQAQHARCVFVVLSHAFHQIEDKEVNDFEKIAIKMPNENRPAAIKYLSKLYVCY